MDERERLLLAVAVVQWHSVVEHTAAMEKMGVEVPTQIKQRLVRELGYVSLRWQQYADQRFSSVEAAVASARAYATEHAEQVDMLGAF